MSESLTVTPGDIVREAAALRRSLDAGFREEVVTSWSPRDCSGCR